MEKRIVVAILALGCVVGIGCRRHARSTPTPAAAPPPIVREKESPPAEPPADPVTLEAKLDEFAAKLIERLGAERRAIAVFPPVDRQGAATLFSDRTAALLTESLTRHGAQPVDRAALAAVVKEIDLADVFNASADAARVTPADALIVGRYELTNGRLLLSLRAVAVPSAELLLAEAVATPADRETRQWAFSSAEENALEESIEEHGDTLVIQAAYAEAGADEFRLLDRVRQRVRRRLKEYVLDAQGRNLDHDALETIYQRGHVAECAFGAGSVTLQMTFEVQP